MRSYRLSHKFDIDCARIAGKACPGASDEMTHRRLASPRVLWDGCDGWVLARHLCFKASTSNLSVVPHAANTADVFL